MINYEWRYKTSREIAPLSQASVKRIIAIDAKAVSETPETYVSRNLDQYYVCINTWLLLSEDLVSYNLRRFLEQHMVEFGLLKTIKHANEYANWYIAALSEPRPTPVEFLYLSDACGDAVGNWAKAVDLLQALRFAKRFTPNGMDKLIDEKLEAFVSVDRRVNSARYMCVSPVYGKVPYRYADQLVQRGTITGTTADACLYDNCRSHTVLYDGLRRVIARMLKGFRLPNGDIGYTNGASQDVCTCELCKELALAGYRTENPFIDTSYEHFSWYGGRDWMSSCRPGVRVRPRDHRGQEFYASKIATVPKDYKGPRIIAPEAFDRQVQMKALAAELERCLVRNGFSKQIPLHDQSVNQEFARLGALDGSLATIDLSHASDSVTKELVAAIFPFDVWDALRRVMPTHYILKDRWYPMHMFGTMGSSLTFIVESIVFYAIAAYSCELAYEWRWRGGKKYNCSAYGDDIIVPSDAAETCLDILVALGFEPNRDKTYITGVYRESCGKEYIRVPRVGTAGDPSMGGSTEDWETVEVSSIYWPRKDMSRDTVTWNGFTEELESRDSSWLHLANRLYMRLTMYPTVCNAHSFLRLWLEETYRVVPTPPQLSESTVGVDGDTHYHNLLGDVLSVKVVDIRRDPKTHRLLNPGAIEIPLDDLFMDHETENGTQRTRVPWYRILVTRVVPGDLQIAGDKALCPHRTLTGYQLHAFWAMVQRHRFLERGPEYSDRLMELLHVSSPLRDYDEALGRRGSVFRTSFTG